jgi:AraC-like DNA-binding protein
MLPQPRPIVLLPAPTNAGENAHLVEKLRHMYGGPKPARQIRDRRLRQLASVVEAGPDDWKAIQGAIKATRLSCAYLSVRFKEEADLPLRSYALWCKFERACVLVAHGTSPKEAALMAGFSDQSHMGRAARRFARKSFGQVQDELALVAPAHSGNDPATSPRPVVRSSNFGANFSAFPAKVTRLRSPYVEYQEPPGQQSGMVGSSSGR